MEFCLLLDDTMIIERKCPSRKSGPRAVCIVNIMPSQVNIAYSTSILQFALNLSVDVRNLQVAILARSPREMSLTDRILPRYILSRVRVSVSPKKCIREKKPNQSRPHVVYFN